MSTVNPDIQRLIDSIAVTSGVGTYTLPVGMANKVLQIIVIPPSESYSYRVYISESLDNITLWGRDDEITGTYNELFTTAFPIFGNTTFHITNASADGTYKVRIVYE